MSCTSYVRSDQTMNCCYLLQAANNLTVLAREEGACQIIIEQGGLSRLKELVFSKTDVSMLQAGVRVLGNLTQNNRHRVRAELLYMPY